MIYPVWMPLWPGITPSVPTRAGLIEHGELYGDTASRMSGTS